jgi:hypothetical protein
MIVNILLAAPGTVHFFIKYINFFLFTVFFKII